MGVPNQIRLFAAAICSGERLSAPDSRISRLSSGRSRLPSSGHSRWMKAGRPPRPAPSMTRAYRHHQIALVRRTAPSGAVLRYGPGNVHRELTGEGRAVIDAGSGQAHRGKGPVIPAQPAADVL